MSSAQCSSAPELVKIEDANEETLIVPTMSKEAFNDAMNTDLSASSDKWHIAESAGKVIEVTDEEDEQPGQAHATPAEHDDWTWRKAEQAQGGKRKRRRKTRVATMEGGEKWSTVGAAVPRASRAPLGHFTRLPRRQQKSTAMSLLRRVEAAAVQRWPIGGPPPKRRAWTQLNRNDAGAQPADIWEEPQQRGSPMHPNPRAHIWPTKPPAGLQSKSRGGPPPERGRTLVELTAAGIHTPATPPPPPQALDVPVQAPGPSQTLAVMPKMPPTRADAMQGMLTSMAALLSP